MTAIKQPGSNDVIAIPDQRVVQVQDLDVRFATSERVVDTMRNLLFHVDRGETLVMVGESGSGESMTSLALMWLVEHGDNKIIGGQVHLRRHNGEVLDLTNTSPAAMRGVRGADIAMVFQEPMTSLNPVFTVGEQIAGSTRLHQGESASETKAETLRMLELVRIPEVRDVLGRYLHQLSGGTRQRMMITMALPYEPSLLIADESITTLDVTIQVEILQLIRTLQQELHMAVVFITHDMGVVAEVAGHMLVAYKGDRVEEGPSATVLAQPACPYTRALLSAVPHLGSMRGIDGPARFLLLRADGTAATVDTTPQPAASHDVQPILRMRDLVTRFDVPTGIFGRVTRRVHAVEQISFDLYPGEALALVGESGCDKSTAGRSFLRLVDSQNGSIEFAGRNISELRGPTPQALHRNIQFIFQDPFASLGPRMPVGYSIVEPLLVHKVASGREAQQRMGWLLDGVGLQAVHASRYPHEFSGGQRQRICITHALALNPKVVIADESASTLDVSIRAQIVNLMFDLQKELGVTFLFISHDMTVVERISRHVAMMYLDQVVKIGPRHAIFENPQHPYTKRLMSAVPIADPARRHLKRELFTHEVPSLTYAVDDLPVAQPLVQVAPNHFVARHSIGGAY